MDENGLFLILLLNRNYNKGVHQHFSSNIIGTYICQTFTQIIT